MSVAVGPVLKKGSKGPAVVELQDALRDCGYDPGKSDGDFGPKTHAAVVGFQTSHQLTADGVVGPKTRAAIAKELSSGTTDPAPPPSSPGPSTGPVTGGPNEAGPNRLYNVKDIASKTSNAFRWELLQLSARLKTDPSYIAAVMASETGGTFSPSIKNPLGGATGLIQFMPPTAKALGTTVDQLAQMSAEQQLVYVEKYFKPHAGKMKTPTDVYMACFLPVFIGKPPSFVIGRQGDDTVIAGKLTFAKVYDYNKGFDKNKDGTITVGEVGGTVEGILAKARTLPPILVTPEGGGGEPPATGRGNEWGFGGERGEGNPLIGAGLIAAGMFLPPPFSWVVMGAGVAVGAGIVDV